MSALFRVPFDLNDVDIGGVSSATSSARISERERATQAITRWNLLENRLAIVLANQRDTQQEFRLDDKDVVNFMIDRLANLSVEHPHNMPFENAVDQIGLNDQQRGILKAAGATDLKSIAQAIRLASKIDRYNSNLANISKTFGVAGTQPAISPIEYPISSKDAVDICKTIGNVLQNKVSDKNAKK